MTAEERLRTALAKYGEHQHEWVPTPAQKFTDGKWRYAVEPEEGWDRTGVGRMCPEDGVCWCGLDAALAVEPVPVPEVDAAWEALSREQPFIVRHRWDAFIANYRPIIEAAIRQSPSIDVERWLEAVSDSLAATTMGTDYAEAPEPSDEPGSPYVRRLTNELLARLAAPPEPGP